MSVALATATDAVDEGRNEETRDIPTQPPPAPLPPPIAAPPAPAARGRSSAPPSRTGGGMWGTVGTAAILAAVVLVFLVVILPLLQQGRSGGSGDAATPTPVVTASPVPNEVAVPDFVGMGTREAEEAANAAGLDWTVHCDQDKELPAGIIDQEPPAGTTVARGSALSLYSARIKDCRG